jgi:hypothetical protein
LKFKFPLLIEGKAFAGGDCLWSRMNTRINFLKIWLRIKYKNFHLIRKWNEVI